MKLREFTTETNDDGTQVVRVRARVSDHEERTEQSEWIELQLAINLPTRLNGAIQRQTVLKQARDIFDGLARDFGRVADSISE